MEPAREARGASGELACDAVLGLLTDLLEEALPAGRRELVTAHLAGCPACSGWLAQLRATIEVLGCLRDGVVPAPALTALRDSFHTPDPPEPP
ncbi:anti-sigma factor family protein [Nonomuraea jiangxiensis]|uniref:Putative zinc-finger n=1 Tax=Nonomuraea jiangxiensis TaxID=633440 RepID=A0A1G7ZQ44_9ACTN|nr:zf-HC2 domain-containing protein [Nonomuraea jiangxiensis]SDH10677.1 Putative zinc-finger [Nonomuraea jiangxiensis]